MELFGIPRGQRPLAFTLILAEFQADPMKFVIFILVGAFMAFPIGLLIGFTLGLFF
jgi:hypothetical protein